jgi:soluble epoxide hydrolase / lipid-phosphate phosphatase
MASHHPHRCPAVASLCVPYYTLERGLDHTLALVDSELYPEIEFPAGQWDYMRYEENFTAAIAPMDGNVYQFVKLLFRKGDPTREGKQAFTATARRHHSFLGINPIPDLPRDNDVVSEEDLSVYVSALTRNGFFGPRSGT